MNSRLAFRYLGFFLSEHEIQHHLVQRILLWKYHENLQYCLDLSIPNENNLPDKFPEGVRILVVDPMLATGGTMCAAIDLLKARGAESKQIKIISAVAAPPALEKLSKKFPGLRVYTGMIDPIVNEKGFIVPGLGDAGDRSFGT